jgi:hypothetical protein
MPLAFDIHVHRWLVVNVLSGAASCLIPFSTKMLLMMMLVSS